MTTSLKLAIGGLTAENQDQIVQAVTALGAERMDVNLPKQLIRIISVIPITPADVARALTPRGLTVGGIAPIEAPPACSEMQIGIDGMHCRSCEVTIERRFKKIPGVAKVVVNADKGIAQIQYQSKPSLQSLQEVIAKEGYTVRASGRGKPGTAEARPRIGQLIGLFALVLVLGKILNSFGLLTPAVSLGAGTSLGAIFLLGLVAASSSCIAVSGGLMLSAAAKFRERYGAGLKPIWLFVLGRIVSYALWGGLIGLLGNALSPSPFVTGAITIVAAVYMLIMGLDMIGLAPTWLKAVLPRLPKTVSHRVLAGENKTHAAMPLLLGAGTFFLPCGFTQALQLYALTTGSFTQSALTLGVFALGTAPALVGLGLASGSLKGKAGTFFFRFSGALVIVLGLWNIQNGLTITGHPLTLAWLFSDKVIATSGSVSDPNVVFTGSEQIVRMRVENTGYVPSHFTLRAGVPTTWIVDGKNAGGCLSVLQAPKLGIRQLLQKGETKIAFTPQTLGAVPFSCSMGMFRGEIKVVPTT